MKHIKYQSIFLLLVVLFCSPLLGQAMTPLATVSLVYQKLKHYDAKHSSAKEKAQIDSHWMYKDISMDAIQDQWDKMSSSQQQRYLVLMRKLLEKTIYEDTGDKLKKGTPHVIKQLDLSDTSSTVKTKITIKKNNNTVSNDYTLHKVGNNWMIRIIFIDGSNLAEDYRSQYNQIVAKYGIEGNKNALLERIKASLSKEDFYHIDDDNAATSNTNSLDNTVSRPSLIN